MTDRVSECIYPESSSCRGCSQSFNPELYDGGCMLHYNQTGSGKAARTGDDLETTARQGKE
jgi:hypothetical protein